MPINKIFYTVILILFALFTLTYSGCLLGDDIDTIRKKAKGGSGGGTGGAPPVPVTGVALNKSALSLSKGSGEILKNVKLRCQCGQRSLPVQAREPAPSTPP